MPALLAHEPHVLPTVLLPVGGSGTPPKRDGA